MFGLSQVYVKVILNAPVCCSATDESGASEDRPHSQESCHQQYDTTYVQSPAVAVDSGPAGGVAVQPQSGRHWSTEPRYTSSLAVDSRQL